LRMANTRKGKKKRGRQFPLKRGKGDGDSGTGIPNGIGTAAPDTDWRRDLRTLKIKRKKGKGEGLELKSTARKTWFIARSEKKRGHVFLD